MLGWILLLMGVPIAAYVAMGIYLSAVLRWEDEETVGVRYYGRPPAGRERFRRQLRRHARLLAPMLRLNARLATFDFRKVRMQYKGVSAPLGSCSVDSFAGAEAYAPTPADVFVVTQMKCGTTWMQQVVHETLCRGNGTLVESGTALYAVSPWLEGRKSVSVDAAPLLGAERPSRIIKTHLPAALCPFSPAARYIYVARHPVSCFASCIDFVRENAGGLAPGMAAFEEWYCSPDLMWWGTWTDHLAGWWERSRTHDNVLFLRFEDMKRDLPAVAQRVAAFLGVAPLAASELAEVVRKSGFEYMRVHQDAFEMHPPHLLQAGARLFISGSAERHKDVPAEVRARVAAWACRELQAKGVPVEELYPELLAAG